MLGQPLFAKVQISKYHHEWYMRGPRAGEIDRVQAEVDKVVAEDKTYRHAGVSDGLYCLDDAGLAPFARLGHGVPTIRSFRAAGQVEFQRAADSAVFAARLAHVAPFLCKFDFAKHGLILAGGAVSSLLMHDALSYNVRIHDYDMFLVGHSDESALRAIEALRDHMLAGADEHGLSNGRVCRTRNCITFCFEREVQVQIILRHHAHPAEVLHSFDLGSSAFLWDGAKVHMTATGKFAATHGANILNLAARRASYELRLSRYFNRGFDLVVPGLKIGQKLGCNLVLPYVLAANVQVQCCGCSIGAYMLVATKPTAPAAPAAPVAPVAPVAPESPAAPESPNVEETSKYQLGHIKYNCPLAIFRTNVWALTQTEVKVTSLCADAPLTPNCDVRTIRPTVSAEHMEVSVRHAARRMNAIDIKTLRSLLGDSLAAEAVIDISFTGKLNEVWLTSAITKRCALLNAGAHIPFKFMAADECNSFTPLTPISLAEWLGKDNILAEWLEKDNVTAL